jgi:transcriptional regulator with XRE-family HTH domain
MPRPDLARFLRDRRADLRPADVGLPSGPRRRTPGLRREEVARLANMSVEYYVRLEQARGPQPSARILESLTSALRLDPAERTRLFRLAGTSPTPPAGPARTVRPYVTELLDRIPDAGAIVTDATYGVLAWNGLARAVWGPELTGMNLARSRFLGLNRFESTGFEEFGSYAVSRLRNAVTRYPRDPSLARLLADLRAGSPEFVELWNSDPVRVPGHRSKTVEHPELGRLRLNCDVLAVPDDDQQVVFITADPGSPTAKALRALRLRA